MAKGKKKNKKQEEVPQEIEEKTEEVQENNEEPVKEATVPESEELEPKTEDAEEKFEDVKEKTEEPEQKIEDTEEKTVDAEQPAQEGEAPVDEKPQQEDDKKIKPKKKEKTKKKKGKKVKEIEPAVEADAGEEEGGGDQAITEPPTETEEESPAPVQTTEKGDGKKQKGKKAKKKKSRPSTEEEVTFEDAEEQKPKEKKTKKKKSEVSTEDDVAKEPKKKKKKKKKEAKETPSTTDADMPPETVGKVSDIKIKKKKGKGKKVGKTASSFEGDEKQLRKKGSKGASKTHSLKGKKSSGSIKKKSSSKHSISSDLRRKMSSHAELAKKASKYASTQWTFTESLSSEEQSEEEEEDLIETKDYESDETMKTKKKGKKGKGKKEKKKKLTLVEAEVTEEDKEDEGKEKKKKKKGKKRKHAEEEETTEATVEPQVDVLAEITKLKYLAELEASGEETEAESTETEKPVKKKKKKRKKGPKKKLSKKEKQRLAAEAAEKARITAEEEAAKAAELERIRLAEERKAAIEKEKREGFEQQIRMEQLDSIMEEFRKLVTYNKTLRADAKTQAEWEFYVNCGRLPNPSKCDQMNTFLHLWENIIQETSMDEAAKRTVDVLELLEELDDLIDTAEDKRTDQAENWKWVRLLFRQQQAKSLDVATYKLLRNIEKNLNRIDIPTADYKYQDENLVLCLWLRIQLPTPLPNPRRPPKPRIEVDFPDMKMEAQFPLSIDGDKTAVRALYVKYNHLSDLSKTYQKPPIPEKYDIDLATAMKQEWREKLLYKYNHRVRKTPPPPKEGEEPQETPEVTEEDDRIGSSEDVPIVPYRRLEPTASEYVIANEDTLYNEIRARLVKTVEDDVINLRKYTVIGGVYSLNLIHQPPQPQDFVTLEMNLTPLYLPKQLEFVDLYLDYDPPKPPEPGVRRLPEEIEEEMKKQDEELEKLILITLTWPEHVIFLELPMVCYWDNERCVWTKQEIHDLKHNEEKGQLSFRTRKGGTFALAVYRYANLPYQTWEMKPEANGSISLQITAAILMVEFNVKDGLIALSQLQNSPNNALQDIVGLYFPLPKLIRMLQSAGVDVFPAFDAFCYIETTCEKHWPMEKHLYFNMAQLGICFNFVWSRWNVAAGRRNIVLQMREYSFEKTKQKNHLMLHVTPLNAIFVDCSEVSQTFNEEGIENMKFYPDLYHLMKGTSSMAVKNKITKASKELVYAVYEILLATRVVSFS